MSDANLPEVELEPNEDIIERTAPGEEPLWLWAQTCPLEDCPCRVALMVAASSREQLDVHAAIVREAWSEVEDAADFSGKVPPEVIAFEIEIDSGAATMPLAEDETLSPAVSQVLKRLDGELLDRLASLWYLGKDLEDLSAKALEPADIKDFKPGQLLAWDEVYEGARMDVFLMQDGSAIEAIETYCVRPKCQCNDVHIQFYQLPDNLDGAAEIDEEEEEEEEPEHDAADLEHIFLGTVCIKVEQPVSMTYQPAPDQAEPLASMLRRYQERYPNWVDRLAQRADTMAQFGEKLHAHFEQQRRKPWVSSSRKRRGARH